MASAKRLTQTCAAVLLFAAAGVAQTSDWIRIGSWNIENLPRGDGQAAPALAEHIRLAGVDILALQEIHDTDPGPERKNRRLDEVIRILNENSAESWRYELFPNKRLDDETQLTGVAWNSRRVAMDGAPFRIAVEDNPQDSFNVWDRHPHAVKFRAGAGKTDIVLITVHMKSNVGGQSFARRQRAEEARVLAAKLDSVRSHFNDRDIVIIGDTNCLNRSEPALAVFRNAGFTDLNAADVATFVTGRSPFDRILVPQDQPEFRFTRQYVLLSADRKAHESNLSDHHLILCAVKVQSDDDP